MRLRDGKVATMSWVDLTDGSRVESERHLVVRGQRVTVCGLTIPNATTTRVLTLQPGEINVTCPECQELARVESDDVAGG